MFKTRAISAILAILLLAGLFYFLRTQGLYLICGLAALIGSFEFSRLAFKASDPPLHIRVVFVILAFALFLTTVFGSAEQALGLSVVGAIVFLTMSLLTIKTSEDLKTALQMQYSGLLGLFYVGLFPGLAVRLLTLDNGFVWLFGLMAIVFSGDTFAYLTGRLIGKNKLLAPVSPKKTIEGSMGGLIGSGVAGAIMGLFFLNDQPLWALVFTALTTGAFAQVGDLFESLLKRVAEVKDSGAIMPGHGGVLDRIDGVLFSAPVYYVLVRFLVGV